MRKLVITLVFMTGFLLLTSFNTKTKGEIVDLRFKRGLYFANLELNDKKGYFLVDTGAIISVLDVKQSKHYDFKYIASGAQFVGVGGKNNEYRVSKYSLEYNDQQLPVLFKGADLSPIVESFQYNSSIKIVGIIGANFFVTNKAVIDYGKHQMIIYKK